MTIKNPEQECKTAPETFSAESKITDIELSDSRKGIILDNIDEVSNALIVYSGSVEKARATQNQLMNDIGYKKHSMNAALLVMGGIIIADGFTKRLIENVQSQLKKTGHFYKSFDYDAMGTNFFKTSVLANIVNGKYVLEFNAAYVNNEPEKNLAKVLDKPRALINSDASGKLSIVDGWWFNANLESLLKNLPITKGQFPELIKHIVSHGYAGDHPDIIFEHDKQKFSVYIGLGNLDRYLRPEGCNNPESDYLQARGNNIVGGAWRVWDERGQNKISPTPAEPSIIISVALPGEKYHGPGATSLDQMKAMQVARDHIADLIRPK